MKSRVLSSFFAGLFSLGLVTSVDAELIPRLDGQVVYDTDLDITWLADGNLPASNTFGVVGIDATYGTMNWHTANKWIAEMNADGGTGYLGFHGWRLPVTPQPDPSCGGPDPFGAHNCTGSEMGHLYYEEFGATAFPPGVVSGDPTELAKFTNYQNNERHWFGTESALDPDRAWTFDFLTGFQRTISKDSTLFHAGYVWAVHPGDIGMVPRLPAELIAELVRSVISLNLQEGISNALDSKLRNTLKMLDENNGNDEDKSDGNKQNANLPAINMTYAFIYSVEAQRDKEISAADADSLIKDANAIINSLGGGRPFARGKPIIVIKPGK